MDNKQEDQEMTTTQTRQEAKRKIIPLYFGQEDYSLILPLKPLLSEKSQKILETTLRIMEVLETEDDEEKTTLAARAVAPLIRNNK